MARPKKVNPLHGPYKFHPHTGDQAEWGRAWFWHENGWLKGRHSAEWGRPHNRNNVPAPHGQMWVDNIRYGGEMMVSVGTPFTATVASETYWCS